MMLAKYAIKPEEKENNNAKEVKKIKEEKGLPKFTRPICENCGKRHQENEESKST